MARLEDKIAEIADARLRETIRSEVAALKKSTRFGLVFEQHQPERVPLYAHKIRRDDRVARRGLSLNDTWRVRELQGVLAGCVKEPDGVDVEWMPLSQLVAVRTMGEPIFPALIPLGAVHSTKTVDGANPPSPANPQSAQAPNHILIEADNYHALQLLLFAYEGKLDCIYIDPPYNTGARDWKYNNDYVDGNDRWRHSKWLSMMQRRLKLATRLLKQDGVLCVTIDDCELHHLGVMLSDVLPTHEQFLISIEHNKRGRRGKNFAKSNEFAVFLVPQGQEPIAEEMVGDIGGGSRNLRRTGSGSRRAQRWRKFYPIYVNESTLEIVRVGDSLPLGQKPFSSTEEGIRVIWPIDDDDVEKNWHYGIERTISEHQQGKVFARYKGDAIHIYYTLKDKDSKKLKTVWSKPSLDASTHGTEFLEKVFGIASKFDYPKSLYAVHDCIQAVVASRPNALILDFFAGSGTTLNAVNLLNAADGGQRQCILVTNNEVSEAEAATLEASGLQPGDRDWEEHGICRSVTWPRSKFTIKGHRDDGTPLPGEYLTGKTKTIEKARTVRQLGLMEGHSLTVPLRKQLAAVMEGVTQSKVSTAPWLLDADMGISVLWDVQQGEGWCEALAEGGEHVHTAIIVTTDKRQFEALRERVIEMLGPITEEVEDKRPLSAGFAANLEYFKLDFLDPREVQLGRQFSGVLPVLWMMAGAKGPRPEPPATTAPWLIPDGCPFAVLLHESRSKPFFAHIAGRDDLTHVFFVTNSHDAFVGLKRELGRSGVRAVQLYRDYLENFKINTGEGDAA